MITTILIVATCALVGYGALMGLYAAHRRLIDRRLRIFVEKKLD